MAKIDPRLDPDAWGASQQKLVIIGNAVLPLLNAKRDRCVSSLLFGANAICHAQDGEWSLLSGQHDGYLGWAKEAKFLDAPSGKIRQVHALSTHLYEAPDIKSLPISWLPMGAEIEALEAEGEFIKTPQGFLYAPHLKGQRDAAGYAEMFLETPYLWGGGSSQGIDCSGLVQRAYAMTGVNIPRDSDQQEAALSPVKREQAKRGDLVFWKGHVGILADANTMIHATAFVMKTIKEDLDQAIMRIGEPTSFTRVDSQN